MNRAPLQTNLNRIRTRLTQSGSPTMQILANRLFLYDPLERGGEDFWSREQFLAEIEQMPSIPQRVAHNLFQTVLTEGDKVMLQCIVRHQVDAMNNALEQSDYPAADCCWNPLNQLRIIEHGEIDELMARQIRPHMRAYAQERTAAFNRHAAQHDFTEAENLLSSLRALDLHFPENLVDLEGLEATLQTARAQYTAQREEAEARQKAEEATKRAEEARQKAEEATKRAEEEQDIARKEREAMKARIRRLQAELEEVQKRRQNQTRARNN
jgi:hypothetical protein